MSKKNSSFSKQDLEKLAVSIHLVLTQKEEEEFLPQLQETINSLKKLAQMKIKKTIKLTHQTTNLTNVFFDDGDRDFKRTLTRKETFSNNKKGEKGYFVVKKIL